MVEQRYQAVREVIDSGDSITEIAARYGVARSTLHLWLNRGAEGGLSALAAKPSKPARHGCLGGSGTSADMNF